MEKRMESGKFVEGPEASTTVQESFTHPRNHIPIPEVSVDISIEDDALLPIPADDITTVREVVGTFVTWLEHLIDVVPIMGKASDDDHSATSPPRIDEHASKRPKWYLYDNFVPNSKKKVMFISPHTNILGVGMVTNDTWKNQQSQDVAKILNGIMLTYSLHLLTPGINGLDVVEQCFPKQKNITMKLTNKQVLYRLFLLLITNDLGEILERVVCNFVLFSSLDFHPRRDRAQDDAAVIFADRRVVMDSEASFMVPPCLVEIIPLPSGEVEVDRSRAVFRGDIEIGVRTRIGIE
ncbi:hypothetical protein Lal_00043630 [Lupinus albus]|nr:hypothetical protein Lal_00043630 [Lupinus albus]